MLKNLICRIIHSTSTGKNELARLDSALLDDIGVAPDDATRTVSAWPDELPGAAVIASGLSARWSLSGDWNRIVPMRRHRLDA